MSEVLLPGLNVSRETLGRLHEHVALLEKWNRRINLVSKRSLGDAWRRHVLDSAQLWLYRPRRLRLWLDLGSGAGFPGIVIAALAAEHAPDAEVWLVESDQRKAAFLQTAATALRLRARVLVARAEALSGPPADVISARALAPLRTLLGLAENRLSPEGICLFPKGGTVHNELVEAASKWRFKHVLHPSLTEAQAAIVEIGAIEHA